MFKLLLIGTGGFLGTVLRFLSYQAVDKILPTNFPYGTLFVNIVGSFIIGLVFGLTERGHFLSTEVQLFLAVGFCGGFTTFSSFAYNNLSLLKDTDLLMFFLNISISIIFGILATYAGIVLVRS